MENNTFQNTDFRIRPSSRADLGIILNFVRELAIYEKLENEVIATESDFEQWLFDENLAECVIAESGEKAVGFALFFKNFSTFRGKPGIYLEDLFVKPEYRGHGYGKALLVHLAQLAVARGYARFEWSVLDWNEPSIRFYKALGAVPMDEWTIMRVTGDALLELAKK